MFPVSITWTYGTRGGKECRIILLLAGEPGYPSVLRRHRSCGRIHTENLHVGNQGKAPRGGQGVWVFS
jgi:hypothetical protein